MMLNWKKQKKIWRWVGAIGLLLLLHLAGLSKPLENFISKAVSPLARNLHGLGAAAQKNPDAEKTSEDLALELEVMKNRLAAANIDQSQLLLLAEENDKLREQLNFVSSNNYKVISANIVSRQNLFDTAGGRDIIIDKGSLDGIRSGLGVINEVGVIIGKIVEVRANSARACLTTDSGCQLAAAIINSTQTIGLSDGELGLTIKMNFIPQIEKIAPEDIIITSGLGDSIPRGLVIGRVSQVNNQSNEIWQDVTIEPLASLHNLTVVSVVLP
ncbi:MAG: rod shape-determining protein MreC [bacterium]|nr:rod shape-determining protein MreC [bacterium]